jgi:hypothetical protein
MRMRRSDTDYSKATGAPGYLVTPSGTMKKYAPTTNTVTTLPGKAPTK